MEAGRWLKREVVIGLEERRVGVMAYDEGTSVWIEGEAIVVPVAARESPIHLYLCKATRQRAKNGLSSQSQGYVQLYRHTRERRSPVPQ